jgi:hypothetical protein
LNDVYKTFGKTSPVYRGIRPHPHRARAGRACRIPKLQLSAFVAGTGTFTGLEGGKNLGITAGADLTFLSFRRFRPSFEARSTYPINEGRISSQKNFLLGPKVEYPLGRFHPYADFLIGRGQIDYHAPGFVFGNILYINSSTVVYSPGVGLDCNLTHNLAIKGDVQFSALGYACNCIRHHPPYGFDFGRCL